MYNDVLLAIDLSEDQSWTKSLPAAIDLVKHHGAVLHVMTVIPDFGSSLVGSFFPKDYEHQLLDAAAEKLKAFIAENIGSEIKTQAVVGHGSVYDEVLRVAKEIKCDMIVIGAHRPSFSDYLLGPNAARVVRHANCSVFVVRD